MSLTAAAEVQTGAMIALVPSDADIARLAVPGGEPPEQLHLTLHYLGEAIDYSEIMQHQLIERVADYVKNAPVVRGDGFALAIFNPAGSQQSDGKDREPCVVLEVSGDDVNEAHNAVCGAVDDFMGYNDMGGYGEGVVPEQHKPWIPHITLAYENTADLTAYLDKIGPITFNKVRLAFAGENYDVPLGESMDEYPEDQPGDDLSEAEYEYLATVLGMSVDEIKVFHTFGREGDVNVPGVGHNLRDYWTTGPGAAKIRWGTDGDFTRCTHHLAKYVRDPKGLCAEYHHRATGKWPHPHPHTPTEALEPEAFGGDVVPFELRAAGLIAALELSFDFDPHEPRDAHGRWTDKPAGKLKIDEIADKVWAAAQKARNGQTIASGKDHFGAKHDLVSNGDGTVSGYDEYSDDAHSTFDTKADLKAWLELPGDSGGGDHVVWNKIAEHVLNAPAAPAKPKSSKSKSVPDTSTAPNLAQSLNRLKKITSGKHLSTDDLSSGQVGEVEKIKTDEGVYISKTSKNYGTMKAKDITDAEELVGELGFRIGARVAAVDRVNDRTVNMEFIPGLPAGEHEEFGSTVDIDAIKASRSSRMLGLLDLITVNQDRHDYNWIVNEDDDPPTAVGIDHGLAWGSTPPNSKGQLSESAISAMLQAGESPFVDFFKPYDEQFRRSDIEKARSALDAMEPRFKALGKERWLDVSRQVLQHIEDQIDYTLGMNASP